VSSLYAYDVYREYINPKATGKQARLSSACWPASELEQT
jgi:Na+/proline symporter